MLQIIQAIPVIISILKGTDSTINNSMESDKEVMSRLKFLGKIQKGVKINVKTMTIEHESIATSLSRTWFSKCSRQNTLIFVRNTMRRTFEIINTYRDEPEGSRKYNMHKNVISDLGDSKIGIVNLKNTYLNDIKMCCDLDTILQEIDAYLQEIDVNEHEKPK
jgi:hypothetical protein